MNLKEYCLTDTVDLFDSLAHALGDSSAWDNMYIYADRCSTVLFVAHLDTVVDYHATKSLKEPVKFSQKVNKRYGEYVRSIALDDRLGVWACLQALKDRGIEPDILLTLDEEIGQSTASKFKTDKQYNWMFQFDRHGIKPVLYQYDTKDMIDKLLSVDVLTTFGSFSDICSLDHLGVTGINFGIGYQHEHSPACCVYLSDVEMCINQFVRFYDKYKDVRLPYVPEPVKPFAWRTTVGGGGYRLSEDDYTVNECNLCGNPLKYFESVYCASCLSYLESTSGRGWEDETSQENEQVYACYCDMCNKDMETTIYQIQHADFILCDDCRDKIQETSLKYKTDSILLPEEED